VYYECDSVFLSSPFSTGHGPWSPVKESHVYLEHWTSPVLIHYFKSWNHNITLLAPNQLPRHLVLSVISVGPKCMTSYSIYFVVMYWRVWHIVVTTQVRQNEKGTAATWRTTHRDKDGREGRLQMWNFLIFFFLKPTFKNWMHLKFKDVLYLK
jgi:hypothetical protein